MFWDYPFFKLQFYFWRKRLPLFGRGNDLICLQSLDLMQVIYIYFSWIEKKLQIRSVVPTVGYSKPSVWPDSGNDSALAVLS